MGDRPSPPRFIKLMLYLFTGLPGGGKTLNTLKTVKEDKAFYEYDSDGNPVKLDNGSIKRRPVYYHNIKELKFEDWTKLSDEEAKRPWDIEPGAVLIYDECQDILSYN